MLPLNAAIVNKKIRGELADHAQPTGQMMSEKRQSAARANEKM